MINRIKISIANDEIKGTKFLFSFGNKRSIVKTKRSNIIVGVMVFAENIYDEDTLKPQLKQTERLIIRKPLFDKIGIFHFRLVKISYI